MKWHVDNVDSPSVTGPLWQHGFSGDCAPNDRDNGAISEGPSVVGFIPAVGADGPPRIRQVSDPCGERTGFRRHKHRRLKTECTGDELMEEATGNFEAGFNSLCSGPIRIRDAMIPQFGTVTGTTH